MAMVFPIERAGRNVRISNLKVWLYISLYGRIKLGTFGDCDYYAFKCPNHGLVIDIEHGFSENNTARHQCEKCDFKMYV